jgi:hypothetical protein
MLGGSDEHDVAAGGSLCVGGCHLLYVALCACWGAFVCCNALMAHGEADAACCLSTAASAQLPQHSCLSTAASAQLLNAYMIWLLAPPLHSSLDTPPTPHPHPHLSAR